MHLVGDVLVLLQEHVELADADPQVPVRKLIGDVEPQGPKLPPLQCHSVEHTQGEQQELEGLLLQYTGQVELGSITVHMNWTCQS